MRRRSPRRHRDPNPFALEARRTLTLTTTAVGHLLGWDAAETVARYPDPVESLVLAAETTGRLRRQLREAQARPAPRCFLRPGNRLDRQR